MKVIHFLHLRICILYLIKIFLKVVILYFLCIFHLTFFAVNLMLVDQLDSYSETELCCSVCESCCEA